MIRSPTLLSITALAGVAASVLGTPGCGSTTPRTGGDTGGGGAGTSGAAGRGGTGGTRSSCAQDCGGIITCVDGVVYSYGALNAQPCDVQCPRTVVGTCSAGCGLSMLENGNCSLSLCRENSPKRAGDPCATDADCRPTEAVVTGARIDGLYLRCDATTSKCVTGTPPAPVADWLAPCTPALVTAAAPTLGAWVTINDAKCSSGSCLVVGTETCIRQGCVQKCRSDDECPSGTQCSNPGCSPFGAEKIGLCVPAQQAVATALQCL